MEALFTAFAVILSYVESFFPVVGIPGVKLGLANFSILLVMYFLGYRSAIMVNIIRIIIIGAFFGNLFSILFSIAGAVVSFAVMAVFQKTRKCSIITIGILGGVAHNIGQIIVASFVVENYGVITYLPVLMISGIITGTLIGVLAEIVYKRTEHLFRKIGV